MSRASADADAVAVAAEEEEEEEEGEREVGALVSAALPHGACHRVQLLTDEVETCTDRGAEGGGTSSDG